VSSDYITEIVQADHSAQATPATTESFVLGECQYDGMVTEVTIIPAGDLTADNTNYRTFQIVNTGGDATEQLVIATLVTNVAGGSWLKGNEIKLPLSGNPTDLQFVSNDVIGCVETVSGAGVAHPPLQVTVKGRRA